ncbi:MAG: p-hydroxycinnamoyl CoA hydratase/lyase [Pseudomonadota bacterium]|nr:p-hydroxycinnamoyl CoA hydratase/lyase [Pseudomonadota bacterium]MEE2859671.1 p-hydroxycinnamoyl CoA hydratase/lyase [Pseudomonadota bacterium]
MSRWDLETVYVEKKDGVAWITINRPEQRNAMSPQVHFDMSTVLDELEFDDEVQVLVLTGAGKAWCGGQDLKLFFKELDNKPKERTKAYSASQYWRWHKLFTYPKPTIAMVNGYCFGGGFTQLIACDFAIAADDATFGLSEVNWGIIPGGFVSKALNECIGMRDIMVYAMTGEPFDAKEAARSRLITKAVPGDQLEAETQKLCDTLLQLNPAVLKATKEAVKNVRNMDDVPAFDFLGSKLLELQFVDKENGRAKGMDQFIQDKSYRPGLEPYKRSSTEA